MRASPILNENQRRHVLASCQYIDRLLADLEKTVASAAAGSPFDRFLDDLTPEQKELLREFTATIRGRMIQVLEGQGALPTSAPASSRHAVRSGLGFIEIALEELKPHHMRGYGEMPADAVPMLEGLARELQALVHTFEGALARHEAGDARPQPGAARSRERGAGVPALIEADLQRVAALFDGVQQVCDALRAPKQSVVWEALELSAERAAKVLDFPESHAGGVNAAVHAAVTQVGVDRAEDIRRPMANLITKAGATLHATAERLGLPDPGVGRPWTALLREMPAFELGEMTVELRLFLRRALGSSAGHARLRRAIEAQAGERVAAALTAHGALLTAWSARVMAQVRADFDRLAGQYRART